MELDLFPKPSAYTGTGQWEETSPSSLGLRSKHGCWGRTGPALRNQGQILSPTWAPVWPVNCRSCQVSEGRGTAESLLQSPRGDRGLAGAGAGPGAGRITDITGSRVIQTKDKEGEGEGCWGGSQRHLTGPCAAVTGTCTEARLCRVGQVDTSFYLPSSLSSVAKRRYQEM